MNGDLLTTEIKVGSEKGDAAGITHGVFYSIIDPKAAEHITYFTTEKAELDGKMTLTAEDGYTVKVDGNSTLEIPKDQAARVVVTRTSDSEVVYDQVIKNY